MKTRGKIILCVAGISCIILLYYYFDPSHSAAAPKCPFWLLTGYKCPGCGSQRAIHAFLNGHFREGIQYNYLLPPSFRYAILILVLPRSSRLYNQLTSATACIIIVVVFVLWWFVRNLVGV